jgi:Spy/CpxP family protein refolding chaperone
MNNYLRILSIVMAALMLGVSANVAAADPDWRMGPGMMGGYGPGYGMGPGMMGGYGMGPGMMGGYGHGYGMMGYGDFRGLNLNADQQTKIKEIRKSMRTKQFALMGEMMDAQDKLQDLYDADKQDAGAINKQYKAIEDLHRQMVDNAVEAHNRIDAILTKEQRERFRERGRGYGPMMWGY